MTPKSADRPMCICPCCQCRLRRSRLSNHIRKVHPSAQGCIRPVPSRTKGSSQNQIPRKTAEIAFNPFTKIVFPSKAMLSTQRTGFVGAMKFDPARKPAETVSCILGLLIGQWPLTGKAFQSVLRRAGMRLNEFESLCSCFWPLNLRAADRIFAVLRTAGYEGNIDDLWLSVHGRWKPSPAGRASTTSTKGRYYGRSVILVNTGQSRKPGSHRSC
jgi:hypothetical protein